MADRRVLAEPRVLNPFGELVTIPVWLVRQLDKMKMLYWDRKTKHYKMTDSVLSLIFMAQRTSGFVHKPLRAQNLEHTRVAPPDSGQINPIIRALGSDCRGLNVSTEVTRRLESEYYKYVEAEEEE